MRRPPLRMLPGDGGLLREAVSPQAILRNADKEGVASPGLQPVSGVPKQVFRFVARQPILNREQQVFGYELLFRDGIENFFRASDAEAAARSTLDSSLLMGFGVLCDGHKAFINCTRDL